ncbi:hypothetical protein HPB50_013255 [Hyalomma asiaticum]|uniref:Uncharacterized protein n=1 Tax=Hyalomma asiaticum TaxID=266040 RepID=A0ACB7TGW9_HYAAI|nr:hypothetical protein HPB50_013255 [Hyalomma asiaticum]
MAADRTSRKPIIWKYPLHPPRTAVIGDSQTKYFCNHFNPSSPDAPMFVCQPGANIESVGDLIDFVPRGVSALMLHVGTNDVARTSAAATFDKYVQLVRHIRLTRPDIRTIFATLLLPRGPNLRLCRPNLPAVNRFNRESHWLNCRLVDFCQREPQMFFIDHGLYNFPPWMVFAADGVHPSFGGVSLLTWNIYNLILQLEKPVVYNWRDCAVLAEDDDRQVTDSYARVVGRRSPDSDIESYRLSGARPKTRVDTAGAFPIRPLATQSTEAQRNTTKPAFGRALRKEMSRPLQSLKCRRRNPLPNIGPLQP